MEYFAKKIKQLREEQKLTQKQLAKILQTTNSTICDWERERSEPNITMLIKISNYFKTTIDELLINNK